MSAAELNEPRTLGSFFEQKASSTLPRTSKIWTVNQQRIPALSNPTAGSPFTSSPTARASLLCFRTGSRRAASTCSMSPKPHSLLEINFVPSTEFVGLPKRALNFLSPRIRRSSQGTLALSSTSSTRRRSRPFVASTGSTPITSGCSGSFWAPPAFRKLLIPARPIRDHGASETGRFRPRRKRRSATTTTAL